MGLHLDKSPRIRDLKVDFFIVLSSNLTLTFPIARNCIVVVHSFGESLVEQTGVRAAVPRVPPLPIEARSLCLATCGTFLPRVAVGDLFRIDRVGVDSLVHWTGGVRS